MDRKCAKTEFKTKYYLPRRNGHTRRYINLWAFGCRSGCTVSCYTLSLTKRLNLSPTAAPANTTTMAATTTTTAAAAAAAAATIAAAGGPSATIAAGMCFEIALQKATSAL